MNLYDLFNSCESVKVNAVKYLKVGDTLDTLKKYWDGGKYLAPPPPIAVHDTYILLW